MSILIERLKEIAAAVVSAAEAPRLEETLEQIAHVARELTRTKYAALGIPDYRGGLKYFKVSGLRASEVARIPRLPEGRGLLGAIMEERRTIRLEHLWDDPRSVGFPPNHPHMERFLGVPIQLGDRLFGMLYLCDRLDGSPFDEDDQWLVETLAGYAALAIVGAELSERQAHLQLIEDRERIAMELHDGIIQSLYAIGIHLDIIRSSEPIHPEDIAPVIDTLNNVIEDIRQYIMGLSYQQEHLLTVYECIHELRERLYLPEHIEVVINVPHEKPPISPAVFEGLCLMINEALSNSVRHANASRIELRAFKNERYFVAQIEDNGVGFEIDRIEDFSGLGLKNMQKRARIYGGEVIVESQENQGTCLTIQIPLNV